MKRSCVRSRYWRFECPGVFDLDLSEDYDNIVLYAVACKDGDDTQVFLVFHDRVARTTFNTYFPIVSRVEIVSSENAWRVVSEVLNAPDSIQWGTLPQKCRPKESAMHDQISKFTLYPESLPTLLIPTVSPSWKSLAKVPQFTSGPKIMGGKPESYDQSHCKDVLE